METEDQRGGEGGEETEGNTSEETEYEIQKGRERERAVSCPHVHWMGCNMPPLLEI